MTVYRILNTITGKEYVGITVRSLASRMARHRQAAFRHGLTTPLYNAMRTYGAKAFRIEPLATATTYEELVELERRLILERGALSPNGYNIAGGGPGNYGWQMPPEQRAIMSRANTGRVPWSKGKVMTEDFREACRQGQLKRRAREEASGIVREARNKGIPWSEAAKARLKVTRNTPEARHANSRHRRAWWASLSPEQKAFEVSRRGFNQGGQIAEKKRAWWASLTPERKADEVARRHPHRNRKETVMKTTMRMLSTAAALLLLSALPAQAQRLLTATTLNANLAATDTTMTVTSSTGFVVGQLVLIDWEVVRIQELIGGAAGTATLIRIGRGVDGTQQRAHDNATNILVTAQNNDFKQVDPDFSQDCTRGSGQAAIQPWVNTSNGNIWNCMASNSRWRGTNTLPLTWDSFNRTG